MAKVNFPLKMPNAPQVRTLEELREHFDLAAVLGYYVAGKLVTWLNDRYCERQAKQIDALDPSAADFQQRLCAVFGVEYAEAVDLETVKVRNERRERLKQYTADDKILAAVDSVAFTQEELAGLLDKDVNPIYLCGERFKIPANKRNVTYIDVNHPAESISDINSDTKKVSGGSQPVKPNTKVAAMPQKATNDSPKTVPASSLPLSAFPKSIADSIETVMPQKTKKKASGYEVILAEAGPNRLAVMREVRTLTGLGLAEAKDLVDNVPKILKTVATEQEAQSMQQALTKTGAKVILKNLNTKGKTSAELQNANTFGSSPSLKPGTETVAMPQARVIPHEQSFKMKTANETIHSDSFVFEYDGAFFILRGDSVCKMRKDGTGLVELLQDGFIDDIQINRGWLYALKTFPKPKVKCLFLDDFNKSAAEIELSHEPYRRLLVDNNTLYYDTDGKLIRKDLKTENEDVFDISGYGRSGTRVLYMSAVDNDLFFVKDGGLYKLSNGSNKPIKLIQEKIFPACMFIADKKVYFFCDMNNFMSADLDGLQVRKVKTVDVGYVSTIWVHDGFLYSTSNSMGWAGKLYKEPINGGKGKLLIVELEDVKYSKFCIAGDSLFVQYTQNNDTSLTQYSLDGSLIRRIY